jgi:transcriptional regulator with XRE-family HTH domain
LSARRYLYIIYRNRRVSSNFDHTMTYRRVTLKHLRALKDKKQSDIAAATGLTQKQISDYENGSSSPSIPNALKLAEALDVDIATLIESLGYVLPLRQGSNHEN